MEEEQQLRGHCTVVMLRTARGGMMVVVSRPLQVAWRKRSEVIVVCWAQGYSQCSLIRAAGVLGVPIRHFS